jgi:hypothetical protein
MPQPATHDTSGSPRRLGDAALPAIRPYDATPAPTTDSATR